MLFLFFNSLFTYLLQQKTKLNCYKTMICVFPKEGAPGPPRKKKKDNKKRRSGKIKCDKLIGIYGLEACEKFRGVDLLEPPEKMNVDGASEEI